MLVRTLLHDYTLTLVYHWCARTVLYSVIQCYCEIRYILGVAMPTGVQHPYVTGPTQVVRPSAIRGQQTRPLDMVCC